MVRRILVPLLFLCSLPSNGYASTVLVMGDSLSAAYGMATGQGWVELLAHRLSGIDGKHHVINASISGETSSGGLRRIDSLLKKHRPNVFILVLGANDGLRASRPDLIEHNLGKMIAKAKSHGALVLLVGIRLPPNYGTSYNAACKERGPGSMICSGTSHVTSITHVRSDSRARETAGPS